MLISVTVMPIVFDMLTDVPEGMPPVAAPASAITTLFVIVVLVLRVSGVWRLWVPFIGIVAGCIAASFLWLVRYRARYRSVVDWHSQRQRLAGL